MRCFALTAAVLASALALPAAQAAFLVPDGATAPFESWSRGDADSTYAEWDSFSDANGANSPDVGESGLTGASLVQNGAFAIIASSGNIYSFSGATAFDVTQPAYGYGAGYNTRVVVQAQTLGNVPDLDSIQITYNDGSTDISVAPEYVTQESVAAGGFTGLVTTLGWDIAGYNPSSLLFELNAAGSSMSLANLAIDTFAQSTAFAAFPAVVPEPSAALISLVGFGVLALGRRR